MYHFDDKNSGISGAFEIENKDNEYKYFIKYLDEHMMTTIVDETNMLQKENHGCPLMNCSEVVRYTGSEIDIPRNDPLDVSGAVIKKLMINYEQKGHLLYTDNWYTSPKLAIYLDQQNTGLCGTVKKK
ncbi:hypothetical protein ANTQUA_LOCUS660 [Anthophora quadrimaculata]